MEFLGLVLDERIESLRSYYGEVEDNVDLKKKWIKKFYVWIIINFFFVKDKDIVEIF